MNGSATSVPATNARWRVIPAYLVENIGTSPIRLLRALPMFVRALWLERPHVIASTGSEIAIPFFC